MEAGAGAEGRRGAKRPVNRAALQLGALARSGTLRECDRRFLWSGLGKRFAGNGSPRRGDEGVPNGARYTILGDILRTFPLHEMFAGGQRTGRRPQVEELEGAHAALYSVLMRYAALDPEVGYCQGQNFVAGLALLRADGDEEAALATMVALMQGAGLRELYVQDLPLSQALVRALDAELAARDPPLRAHLLAMGLIGDAYALQWFMSLFAAESVCSHDCAAAVWDVLLCDAMAAAQRGGGSGLPPAAAGPAAHATAGAAAAGAALPSSARAGVGGGGERKDGEPAGPTPEKERRGEAGLASEPCGAAAAVFRYASLAAEAAERARCSPACAAAADVLLEAALAMLAARRKALLRGRQPAALQEILLGSRSGGPSIVHARGVLRRMRGPQ